MRWTRPATGGTGTPARRLTSALQREILWHLKGVDAVGGDVVECRRYDAGAQTAIVARSSRWTSCILGEERPGRRLRAPARRGRMGPEAMKIRPATASDYDQLCELFDEVDVLHRQGGRTFSANRMALQDRVNVCRA